MSLFWRQFAWLSGLIATAMVSWLVMAHVLDRGPRTQQVAWQITSAINLTRSAVVAAEPMRRPSLLAELARDEGVRISIAEPTDVVLPLPDTPDNRAIQDRLTRNAQNKTLLASSVNGEQGFWVSFDIFGDPYWLGFQANRFETKVPRNLIGWAALVGLLTMLGAAVITRWITQPLRQLGEAFSRVFRGETGMNLPVDKGPTEVRSLNRRFNRMRSELERVESDRALALAGVSHDIRTPLTRMRMEIELSTIDAATRTSIIEEIERIDSLVSQFVEYSKAGEISALDTLNLEEYLPKMAERLMEAAAQGSRLKLEIEPQLRWRGSRIDLERMLSNIIGNAIRYGGTPELDLHISAKSVYASGYASPPTPAKNSKTNFKSIGKEKVLQIDFADCGPGVPEVALESLLRPFARLDAERSQAAGGSGLGLAIVERLARRYQGTVSLRNRLPSGLIVQLVLHNADEQIVFLNQGH